VPVPRSKNVYKHCVEKANGEWKKRCGALSPRLVDLTLLKNVLVYDGQIAYANDQNLAVIGTTFKNMPLSPFMCNPVQSLDCFFVRGYSTASMTVFVSCRIYLCQWLGIRWIWISVYGEP
jgi:hypothetical protein